MEDAVGSTVDVELLSGKKYTDAELLGVGKNKKTREVISLRLRVQIANRSVVRPVRTKYIRRVLVDGEAIYGIPDDESEGARSQKGVVRDEVWRERAIARSISVWPQWTKDERKEAVKRDRLWLEENTHQIPDIKPIETKRYIMATDVTGGLAKKYLAQLDATYLLHSKLLEWDKGTNVWVGKPMVVILSSRQQFEAFYQDVFDMGVPSPRMPGRSWTSKDTGKIVFLIHHDISNTGVGYRRLARLASSAFTDSYRTKINLPPWVRSGLGDWTIMSVCDADSKDYVIGHERKAIESLRERKQLDAGFFSPDEPFPTSIGL